MLIQFGRAKTKEQDGSAPRRRSPPIHLRRRDTIPVPNKTANRARKTGPCAPGLGGPHAQACRAERGLERGREERAGAFAPGRPLALFRGACGAVISRCGAVSIGTPSLLHAARNCAAACDSARCRRAGAAQTGDRLRPVHGRSASEGRSRRRAGARGGCAGGSGPSWGLFSWMGMCLVGLRFFLKRAICIQRVMLTA